MVMIMTKFELLLEKADRAKEIYEARKDRLDEYLKLILDAMGIMHVCVDEVSYCRNYQGQQGVAVNYSWSCRGQSNGSNVFILESILKANDPVEEIKFLKSMGKL